MQFNCSSKLQGRLQSYKLHPLNGISCPFACAIETWPWIGPKRWPKYGYLVLTKYEVVTRDEYVATWTCLLICWTIPNPCNSRVFSQEETQGPRALPCVTTHLLPRPMFTRGVTGSKRGLAPSLLRWLSKPGWSPIEPYLSSSQI